MRYNRINERKKVVDIYVLLSGYVYVNLEITVGTE